MNHYTQRAIEMAIEGGYEGLEWKEDIRCVEQNKAYLGFVWGHSKEGEAHGRPFSDLVVDVEFWECLGKTKKWWVEIEELKCGVCDFRATNDKYIFCPKDSSTLIRIETPVYKCRSHWLTNWHDFINHLAEGKDPESFFQLILEEK